MMSSQNEATVNTGGQLTFIDQLCGSEPISIVAMQLASTGQGSQWVIIFIFRLKSNFKKTNKSQQHYSNYLVVNDLFTRKIETN